VDRADAAQDILDKDRVTLGLIALAGQERELILAAFRDEILPPRLAERMLADADRLIEAVRSEGRSGYRAQARRALRPGRADPLAEALHNRLRWHRPLATLTAERFELLIARAQVLRLLGGFIEGRILRIHGRRVAGLLHDLLKRRIEDTGTALEGLRLQFPGYAEDLERRLIRRTVLREEQREYDSLTEDGLIGPELRASLMAGLAARRRDLARRPRLDLTLQKSDIVAAFPLFSDMSEADRKALAREMRTIYVAPGTVLLRRDEMPRQVWFIASGAVEAATAGGRALSGQRLLLGRGEMFGQLSILTRRSRRAQITAITHCTLLTLDEVRFLDLLGRSPSLAAAVQANARARGVVLEPAATRPPQDSRVRSRWLGRLRDGLRRRTGGR
jgi:CPA1 family monovalent cation:H+ antiporter